MTTTTLRSSSSPPPPAKRQRTGTDEAQHVEPATAELKPAADRPSEQQQQQKQQPVAGPSTRLDYRNKAFLAPMVRSGTREFLSCSPGLHECNDVGRLLTIDRAASSSPRQSRR